MAHLRRHKRSPYWFLRTRDLDSGKWSEKTTGLRADNPEETRKAQRKADEASVKERQLQSTGDNPAFPVWVPSYIATHWQNKSSQRRYGVAWQAIKLFLASESVIYPRQIKYGHGDAYLRWRVATPVHGRKVKHNTALLELKFLSQLLNEAVKRQFCESNPLLRLGIGRNAQKIKPELSDSDIEILRAGLVNQPEWMRTIFEISLYTGCRFSECAISFENINLATGTIRLRDAKRQETDERKFFTIPIHPRLRPLLERLKARGATATCELSAEKNGRINYFFRQCGINASFHSLRVTFVTRCHRGGLSESEAMRLTNHSSQLVHRVYSRLNVEDARAAQTRIPLP